MYLTALEIACLRAKNIESPDDHHAIVGTTRFH
jgi:hypothetical protein